MWWPLCRWQHWGTELSDTFLKATWWLRGVNWEKSSGCLPCHFSVKLSFMFWKCFCKDPPLSSWVRILQEVSSSSFSFEISRAPQWDFVSHLFNVWLIHMGHKDTLLLSRKEAYKVVRRGPLWGERSRTELEKKALYHSVPLCMMSRLPCSLRSKETAHPRAWCSLPIFSFPTCWPHLRVWAAREGRQQRWVSTVKTLGPQI